MKRFVKMRRILSLIMAVAMVSLLNVPAIAVEESDMYNRIARTKIEELYRSNLGEKPANITQSPSTIGMTADMRDTFFETIDRISELKAEKAWARENSAVASAMAWSNSEIDQEIERLYTVIDSLPVVEMDSNAVAELLGMKPVVPSDTAYVHFYGLTTYVTVSGTRYEVFEIVAYSDLAYSERNRPMYAYNDAVQLLGSDTYTQNQFCKTIKFIIDNTVAALADTQITGASILYSLVDPLSFFSPSSSQSLEMKYKANSYFCYAYVSEAGVGWYDFMQTTERMKIDATVTAYNPDYTPAEAETDGVTRKVSYLEGEYWADVRRPATRYANGDISREEFPLGAKKIYRDNVHKETIPLNYYGSLDTIPGI